MPDDQGTVTIAPDTPWDLGGYKNTKGVMPDLLRQPVFSWIPAFEAVPQALKPGAFSLCHSGLDPESSAFLSDYNPGCRIGSGMTVWHECLFWIAAQPLAPKCHPLGYLFAESITQEIHLAGLALPGRG
jgi:hypothetical protein